MRGAGRISSRCGVSVLSAAFREVLPDMPETRTKQEGSQAIAFAVANHTQWFWAGVYGSEGMS
jgi:hypothetical protein